jgi:alkaline phosphatase
MMAKYLSFMLRDVDVDWTILLLLLNPNVIETGRTNWSIEENPSFWNEQARLSIEQTLTRVQNKRQAKNVILFLGDGMGLPTVTAGRIRKGQMKGQLGEDFLTEMEQFSHLALAKTYDNFVNFD